MSDQLALDTGDERLPPWAGITTVVDRTVHPGDGLIRWAWKMGRQNILLTDARATHRRAAGNELHRVHELLAAGSRPSISSLPVDARGFAESLYALWFDLAPVPLATELTLRHPEHRIRGRIDGVRACRTPHHACEGRGIVLYDIKTGGSQGDRIDEKTHRQTGGGYRILWEGGDGVPDELRGRPVCAGEIWRVYRDGAAGEAFAALERRRMFELSLASYRQMEADGTLPDRVI